MGLAELIDISTFPPGGPMDLTTIRIVGVRVVLEWVVRRWLTPSGTLAWAPNDGVDLRQLVNSDHRADELAIIRATLEQEAREVSHVVECKVELRVVGEGDVLVRGAVTLDDMREYPLSVTINLAGAAVAQFGGA